MRWGVEFLADFGHLVLAKGTPRAYDPKSFVLPSPMTLLTLDMALHTPCKLTHGHKTGNAYLFTGKGAKRTAQIYVVWSRILACHVAETSAPSQGSALLQHALRSQLDVAACDCTAGTLAPGTAPAMMDELAGFTHCLDLSPGLMQMHWKVHRLKPPLVQWMHQCGMTLLETQ